MAKVAIGSIPKKITYVFSIEKEVPVGCKWDFDQDITNMKMQKVIPAFPVSSDDISTMSHAIRWAENPGYNFATRTNYPKQTALTHEIDNSPIKNIRVLSLEERGNGGRAYKALIDNYYIDLREEVLVDAMIKVGISKGGILKGEYVWAKMGAQMKLIRVGSELHRLVVDYDSIKDFKPVNKNELEIGSIYRTRKNDMAVFLGYISTTILDLPDTINNNNFYNRTIDFNYKNTKLKKAMLFCNLSKLDDAKNIKHTNTKITFSVKKKHSYIEKLGSVKIQNNMIDTARNIQIKRIKDYTVKYSKNDQNMSANNLDYYIRYWSDILNMSKFGEPMVELFDVRKLLTFS